MKKKKILILCAAVLILIGVCFSTKGIWNRHIAYATEQQLLSAYEEAVKNGYTGTMDKWLDSMVSAAMEGAPQQRTEYDVGDINFDGKVNAADLTALARYIAHVEEAPDIQLYRSDEDASTYIKGATINKDEHLIIILTDDTEIDVGYVGSTGESTEDKYTVMFKDYDGTVLKTQIVTSGGSATPPQDPVRAGYTFTGWSGNYTNVTSDVIVTATYAASTSPCIELSSATAAPGAANVTLTVSMKNNPGFLTMALKMSFNSDVLTLTKVSNGVDFTDYSFTAPKNKISGCTAAWFASDLPDEIVDGDVMTLKFTVAANAPAGKYPVTISCPNDGSTVDGNKTAFTMADTIGYITVN